MRICDRCKEPDSKAALILQDKKNYTEYDLCAKCAGEFEAFLNPKTEEPKPDKTRKKESKQ